MVRGTSLPPQPRYSRERLAPWLDGEYFSLGDVADHRDPIVDLPQLRPRGEHFEIEVIPAETWLCADDLLGHRHIESLCSRSCRPRYQIGIDLARNWDDFHRVISETRHPYRQVRASEKDCWRNSTWMNE